MVTPLINYGQSSYLDGRLRTVRFEPKQANSDMKRTVGRSGHITCCLNKSSEYIEDISIEQGGRPPRSPVPTVLVSVQIRNCRGPVRAPI